MQWLGRRISDQGVPGSIPGRLSVCCGLEQVKFTPAYYWLNPGSGGRTTDLDRL